MKRLQEAGKTEPSVADGCLLPPLFTLEKGAQQELESGNLGKLRERFGTHGITLTASARLVRQEDRYQIEDDQKVDGTVRPMVFDIIYCVDEYYVYRLLRKEVDTWRRNR